MCMVCPYSGHYALLVSSHFKKKEDAADPQKDNKDDQRWHGFHAGNKQLRTEAELQGDRAYENKAKRRQVFSPWLPPTEETVNTK